MSYCRFSSMNWRCDVYVYEDVSGGWTTHVAGRRRRIPPIPDLPFGRLPRFGGTLDKVSRRVVYPNRLNAFLAKLFFNFAAFWHNKVHMLSLHLIPLRPIGLPHDGERFNDDTPEDCAYTLERLRSMGYVVPQYAIDALRREVATPTREAGE